MSKRIDRSSIVNADLTNPRDGFRVEHEVTMPDPKIKDRLVYITKRVYEKLPGGYTQKWVHPSGNVIRARGALRGTNDRDDPMIIRDRRAKKEDGFLRYNICPSMNVDGKQHCDPSTLAMGSTCNGGPGGKEPSDKHGCCSCMENEIRLRQSQQAANSHRHARRADKLAVLEAKKIEMETKALELVAKAEARKAKEFAVSKPQSAKAKPKTDDDSE